MKRWVTVGVWVSMWLLAFACTVALSLGRPVNRKDEAWMLWVLQRVAGGDVLYRGVYNVTTPLAAWIGAAVVWLTAPQLEVLRALVAAVLATQVVLAASIARRAGLHLSGVVVLATALVAFGSPIVVFTSLYTAFAVLGVLATLRAILWWFDRTDAGASATAPLAATGAAAAFAFWCKPNIGMLALAAAMATIAVTHRRWRRTRHELVPMLVAFGGLSAAVSTVLLVTRSWSDFVDQVVLSKRQYVDVGFSYATAIERRVSAFSSVGSSSFRSIVWLLLLAAPVLVVAAMVWACWRSRRGADPRLAAFVTFGGVGLLGVYPRPGVEHIGGTLPITLTAAACAVVVMPRAASTNSRAVLRRVALAGTSVVVALGTLIVSAAAVDAYTAPDMVVNAPHFAGMRLPQAVAESAARLRDGLRRRTDGVVFIAREDAGFTYLETQTRNPLPYDISERSDFGLAGQRGVIERLRRGEAHWVCLYPLRSRQAHDSLVPHHLERWVRANADFAVHLPGCDLYRATTSRAPGSTTVAVRSRTSP